MLSLSFFTTPPLSYDDVDWAQALCRRGKYSPDIWFDDETVDLAVSICQAGGAGSLPCPIRERCLQYSLDTGQKTGVWGGLTEDQRKVTGWAKHRVKCPGCGSKRVSVANTGAETCFACGLSWKV